MTTSKTGKTLTLKKSPAKAESTDDSRRKRSGARARNASLLDRERDKQTQQKRAAITRAPRPSEARSEQPSAQAKRPSHPAAHAERTARPQAEPEQYVRPRHQRREGRRLPAEQIFRVFTPCPQGLEAALAAELQALGFDDAEAGRAGCSLHTDWTGILKVNLYSRLATRVLMQVARAPVHTEDDILELAADTPWEYWFGPEHTLRVDTSAVRSPMKSLQYCNLRAKDGICDRLRDREGDRPSIDTVRPDARVHLFLDETTATLYLDTSGESLFKRGWRLDKGEAPLRENLAAGLLALSGWDPSQALMDPFCGSGTILIEAAGIALGVPAGIWRPFGFERLRNHDERHWRDIKQEARANIATQLECPIVGYDLDASVVEAARLNLERAWLTPDSIRFEVGDARQVMPVADTGWMVTNPPYGERLEEGGQELWEAWAAHLKKHYAGWHVNIISSDHELPRHMRLKPARRHPLYNGALDCRLFSFDMVAASYRKG